MTDKEDQLGALGTRARFLQSGEACWTREDIEDALKAFARSGEIILGFDIVEFRAEGGTIIRGTSAFAVKETVRDIEACNWNECVRSALDLALNDIRDTDRLIGGANIPAERLWYCVTSVRLEELSDLKSADDRMRPYLENLSIRKPNT